MASEVRRISSLSHHVTLFIGCMKGMVTGVVGVITKPASGILRFTASMASGIGENIMEMGDRVTLSHSFLTQMCASSFQVDREQRVRIRPPRDFGIRVGEDVAEAQLQLWKKTLTESDGEKFRDDVVLDFVRQDKQVSVTSSPSLFSSSPSRSW